MKYATLNNKTIKYGKQIDELLVPYGKVANGFIEYLDDHLNQRIVLCIEDITEFNEKGGISELLGLKKGRPDLNNYALRLKDCNKEEFLELYKIAVENDIPVFFNNFCGNWDTFYGMINTFEISDIYIIEELGFCLDTVAKMAHEQGIKVRVFPNIAQSDWSRIDDVLKFFIMPEDIQYYEDYVDVCELFVGSKMYTIDPVYESYRDQKWFGPIKELIYDYKGSINTQHMVPVFGERRVSCEKRCTKGGACQVCPAFALLSETLEEKGLYFSPDN